MRFSTPDYIFEADELERWHGPLLPSLEEEHDHQLARADRAADFSPASAWMTPPTPNPGAPTSPRRPSSHERGPSERRTPSGA